MAAVLDRNSGNLFHSINSEQDNGRTFSGMSDDSWYSAHAFHEEISHEESDEFHDELNVNWCLFGLRFTTVFLMACVIASVSLSQIDVRLFYLAAIIFAVSAACLFGSFFDCFKRRFFTTTYAQDVRRSLVQNDSMGGKKVHGNSLLIKDLDP